MRAPKTKPIRVQEPEPSQLEDVEVEDVLEMNKEEILDSIERGLRQMLAGEGRPALEFLDELDNE